MASADPAGEPEPGDPAIDDPTGDPTDDLPPAEAARARRRDHDAGAAARSGMRTGLAKQFKQVLDAQARRARAAGRRPNPAGPAPDETPGEPPGRKRGHPGHRHGPPGPGS